MESIYSKNAHALLKAHQFQGLRNDCGPFCAAIVLSSMGKIVRGETLAHDLNKPRWRNGMPVIRRIPNWATFPWGLMDVFKLHGLNAKWKLLESETSLIRGLKNKEVTLIVFIGSIIPLWAHTLILVAMDEEKGWGFVDPAFSSREIQWLSRQHFLRRWSTLGRNVLYISNS